MRTKKTDAEQTEGLPQDGVHTSAQTDLATNGQAQQPGGCGSCGGDCADCKKKPQHHQPSALNTRDEFTGLGGQYVRDPQTGLRTRLKPESQPAGQ